MPGTIHISVLELVGLPSPPQSSSMGVKVSMGKQAYEMQDKEETTFALVSLRENLNVSVHDSEGNEIAHTDVETRSIIEKGTWDDLFPLKDGGHIHMRLHFILTQDELNRIRSMRESAAQKKREDLLKRSRSSSDLTGASGGSAASSQYSLKSQDQSQERSVDPSDSQTNKISADSVVKFLNKAQPGQKKQAFSTSKSTGALDKLPAYQQLKKRFQGQGTEQQSQLDKSPSNVRKMILAFSSSPVKDKSLATNKTWATTQLSSSATVDIPSSKVPSLKKMVAVKTKPVSSKLEAALASSIPEEVGGGRGKFLPALDKTKEMVDINTKPFLSNLDTMPVRSTSEEIGKESGKILPVSSITKETAQQRSNTTVSNPSIVSILKKTVAVNTKTVLFNLDTALAPSTSGEIGKDRGKLLLAYDKTRETDQLSSDTGVDAPYKVPILKKIVAVNSKTAPAPWISEEIGKERGKLLPAYNKTKETDQLSSNTKVDTPLKVSILKKIMSVSSETVLSNPETTLGPSTSEEIGKGRGDDGEKIYDEKNVSKTQLMIEENNKEEKNSPKKWHTSLVSERSIFSLKALLEALPRRKQLSTDLFNKKYGLSNNDDFVPEKKWRSKQWKSSQHRAKSKKFHWNEHCSVDTFRGWIFLDEMIRSCVLNDDRTFVDEVEGCLSNCNQDNDQEKLTDTVNSLRKSEKGSTGSKKMDPNRRPNIPFAGPGGQVMKIAIMAGFGLLVFLTRQRN